MACVGRQTTMTIRRCAGWVLIAFALHGCASATERSEASTDTAPAVPTSPPTSAAAPTIPVTRYDEQVAALGAFEPIEELSGQRCGEMSVSNGTVQIDASESVLPRVTQQATPVAADDLRLTVRFGSGFPGYHCTDVAVEVRRPTVDETWSATATGGSVVVSPSTTCSTATLDLHGVVAVSPAGDEVDVGDVSITDDSWQWWPPFDCLIDLDRRPALDPGVLTESGTCDASVFWAADSAHTVAVIVRTSIPADDESHEIDLTADGDVRASVQIRRGESVLSGLCLGDSTVPLGTDATATAGFVTVAFGQSTGGPCRRSGSIRLDRIYLDDGTLLDVAGLSGFGLECG